MQNILVVFESIAEWMKQEMAKLATKQPTRTVSLQTGEKSKRLVEEPAMSLFCETYKTGFQSFQTSSVDSLRW